MIWHTPYVKRSAERSYQMDYVTDFPLCLKLKWAHQTKTWPVAVSSLLSADHVSCVPGPAEEHDLHVRPRHLPAVRGPNERVPHLPQGHRAPHPALLDPANAPLPHRLSFLSSLKAHADRTRNATITPAAAAAAARSSSQHQSQPAKGVLTCLTGHVKCSLNGLIVFRWKTCYETRRKKYELTSSLVLFSLLVS